jgi:hypothetical protein
MKPKIKTMSLKIRRLNHFYLYQKQKHIMEIHHHHYHHHASGGSLKSIGNAFKHTFSKSNMEHAGLAAIPAATTSLGAMAGGPLGAAAGAAGGYMIDKAIQGHGFGDGLRKGTKAHIKHYRLKRRDAINAKDQKKIDHYQKKYDEAIHHYNTKPYLLLKHDKEHQKNLRQARKHTKKMTPIDFGVDPDEISGNGFRKGTPSSTHIGDLDYTTKKGNLDFHQGGHDVKKSYQPYESGDGFYHRSSKKYNDSSYSNKVDAHMKKLRSAASPWLDHVKQFRNAHPGITYSQALKEAAKTYKR